MTTSPDSLGKSSIGQVGVENVWKKCPSLRENIFGFKMSILVRYCEMTLVGGLGVSFPADAVCVPTSS